MISQSRIITRTATQEDKQKLAYLIHFEVHVHRHLDYRPPLDWVGERPFPILEKQGEIVAALACPPDPPNIAWVRMFASSNHVTVRDSWEILWDYAQAELLENLAPSTAAAIPMQNWFKKLLESSNFQETHRIVMLAWDGDLPEKCSKKPDIVIRPMTLDDLEAVKAIDHASFVPVWQNSQSYLELAFRQAAIATLAEEDGKLVAYQISTATPMGGHLARLAVHPDTQGRGIGFTLLRDLLKQFKRRGARSVTVNTQFSNTASLGLYKKAGFEPTGEEYPIYQLELPK
jgi:[ribosomal protein S18]-alanine N-acetyltransferase